MAHEIVITLVGLFCTIASSIITFILTRKKYNSEVEAQQIQNVKDSFDVYKEMMEQVVNTQNEKIEALQKENDNLKQQINQLQTQLVSLVAIKASRRKV